MDGRKERKMIEMKLGEKERNRWNNNYIVCNREEMKYEMIDEWRKEKGIEINIGEEMKEKRMKGN